MLRGTRSGVVTRVQPISIHGQISLDVFWIDPEDPDSELRHARVGHESVPKDLSTGDRITLHYLMGAVTRIER